MTPATLATLAVLVVGRVAASPADFVLVPSGIPATSGPSFGTLSFNTTAVASSVVSGLSSLISSESTALWPYTVTSAISTASPIPTSTPSPTVATITTTSTPTSTSGTRSLTLRSNDVRLAGVALVLGAIAVLVC